LQKNDTNYSLSWNNIFCRNLLITDSARGESIFDIAPELVSRVEQRTTEIGSDAATCATRCQWSMEDERDEDGNLKHIAEIKLIPDGAFLLAKAIKGRFRYKRHFTVKMDEQFAITFFPEGNCTVVSVYKDKVIL